MIYAKGDLCQKTLRSVGKSSLHPNPKSEQAGVGGMGISRPQRAIWQWFSNGGKVGEKSSEAVTECMGCMRYAYTLTGDESEKGNANTKNEWNTGEWRRTNPSDGWNCKRHCGMWNTRLVGVGLTEPSRQRRAHKETTNSQNEPGAFDTTYKQVGR